MKKLRWGIVITLIVCMCLGQVGCGGTANKYELPYYDQSADRELNSELFYRNDMTVEAADPSVIYCDDESDKENYGWFFLYPTRTGVDYEVYKSRDCVNWQFVSTAFKPEKDSFAKTKLWAPEVIYDSEVHKYFMFFHAAGFDRDEKYFESRAEWKEYKAYEKETEESDLESLTAIVGEFKAIFGGADEAEGYTESQFVIVKNALSEYDSMLEYTERTEYDSIEEKEKDLMRAARNCVIKIKSAKMNIRYANNDFSVGVAVSDSPTGPFVQYTNVEGEEGYDETRREIGINEPFIIHEDFAEHCPNNFRNLMTCLDLSPYKAPDGKKYLYFSQTNPHQEYIYGVQLGDNWTDDPKWETLTPLTRSGYKTVNGLEMTDYMENTKIDEGPHMFYDEEFDEYHLTFSINGCWDRTYAVAQAIGKSPLGPFTKVDRAKGGMVITADPSYDHVGGPGHHSFVKYNGKLYIAYQGLFDKTLTVHSRGVCVDEVKTIVNSDGQKLLYANGPSYSPMPVIVGKYHNIASEATVEATNGVKDADKSALNDELLSYSPHHDIVKEFDAKKGTTKITLKFADYRTIRAVMVFNSKNLETVFDEIKKIELDFKKTDSDGKEIVGTAFMNNLKFDKELYTTHWEGDHEDVVRPGGSVCVEFDELDVKQIRIEINSKTPVSIAEIFVLGL